jgi:transcriptional regulator GlxA family with amidase domain
VQSCLATLQSCAPHPGSSPRWRALSPPPRVPDLRIRRALEVIERDYSSRLTVAYLAEIVGLSRSRFEHLFRTQTGKRLKPALRRIRLSKSQALLAGSTLSIKEIADRVGFRSASAFSRAFEKLYREPPSRWRRRRAEAGDGTFG